ncbi:MAG: hypothetical protein IJW75_00625 [Alphaproteobacteria bacterium]|nr:hypothetical protein [Alphaproteobacteria bacterium]
MVCTLALIVASFFIWVNPTCQPAIIIALVFLIKLPFCFALTYVKDRENTALIAMTIGVWIMYEIIIITTVSSMMAFFLLFGPIAILGKNGEDLLDYKAKSTPKNLVVIGVFLCLMFAILLTFMQNFFA